jgi:hypothetical protein
MPSNPVTHPIHYFYWGSEIAGDVSELNEINNTLNWQGDSIKASILEHVINPISGADFLNILEQVCKEPNCQIIYISTHGSGAELYYDGDDNYSITMQQLITTLTQSVDDERCMTIVFGSCHTVATHNQIENLMPSGVTKIYGFSHCPTPKQVAQLMAKVICNTEHEFIELSSVIKAIPPVPINDYIKNLKSHLTPIIDNQEIKEMPQGYVDQDPDSSPGYVIRISKCNGTWVRKNYILQ